MNHIVQQWALYCIWHILGGIWWGLQGLELGNTSRGWTLPILICSLIIHFQTATVSDSNVPFRIKLHKLDKTAREILLEKGTTSEYLKRKYSRYETGPEPEPLSNYMDVSYVLTDTLTNWRIRKYCQMCILFYMLPSVRYNHS